MAGKPRNRSRADDVYAQIRADIFAARLQPGQRLKFQELCERYQSSVGVAREALSRLELERLVHSVPRIGFTVTSVSTEELFDLTTARAELEALAFRLSIEHGGIDWETSVVAAHHHLSRTTRPSARTSDSQKQDWFESHETFHRALFQGCPSRRLRQAACALRDEGELYRRWSDALGVDVGRDVAREHEAILDAALARDTARAVTLLQEHIWLTSKALLEEIDDIDPAHKPDNKTHA